eukprot:s8221_g2.t1
METSSAMAVCSASAKGMEAGSTTAFDGYVAINATLKALREQRVAREAERNWERPEVLYLAGESSPALRLCSASGLAYELL